MLLSTSCADDGRDARGKRQRRRAARQKRTAPATAPLAELRKSEVQTGGGSAREIDADRTSAERASNVNLSGSTLSVCTSRTLLT